jgi:DNA mismatch repair protein MutS2
MLQLFPNNASERLEFDKVKALLLQKCESDGARERVAAIRFQTRIDSIEKALQQTLEYRNTLSGGAPFPNNQSENLNRELKLLGIPNAVLQGKDLSALRALALNMKGILQWFNGRQALFPHLFSIVEKTVYEPEIAALISGVIDDSGIIRDNASSALLQIRMDLEKARQQLRRVFESVLRKLHKQGYLADISESFLNGRRSVAVFAEHKRIVKGILHGSSDTQKTVFIEPEETIELNNAVYALEREEHREIQRILAQVTASLSVFQPVLEHYYRVAGLFDFIRAKALLARDMNAELPGLSPHPGLHLIRAYHPLLWLQNQKAGKITVPLNIKMDSSHRILMISGPNAGGKTVSMKTAGLLQLMLQAGLLVPADPRSEMGIFRQMMIHIGDTQSIENELSTYSAHLKDMKYFLDFANGKTLFFIDELGSGSDPNLGGAFAEAIVEMLARKNAYGIITTHYLNLKVMAGKVKGIFNGAMSFDEENLLPLYHLVIGKPGSSYTFAIAERSGLPEELIARARQLTDRGHFKLDKMLLKTEQQSVKLEDREQYLDRLITENEQIKARYEALTDKEKRRQHIETLKLQNKIKQEELDYLKETERKFKQIIHDWKKTENKQEVIASAENILFRKKQIRQNEAAAKKADKRYKIAATQPKAGDLMRNTVNHQVGRLEEIKGKNAIIKIGNLPFTVSLKDWVVVVEKRERK